MPFHPWRRLRDQPHLDLVWRAMPTRRGVTTSDGVIVLHPSQLQVERRCDIAHELAHVELGHMSGCSPVEERAATQLAARWLIDMDALLDAYRWAEHIEEVADCLWVDVDTLQARLDSLTPDETAALVALWREVERGC